jgi:hypothetical protein
MNRAKTVGKILAWIVLLLCGCTDHAQRSNSNMTPQPEQKITALSEADQRRLRDQRAVVEKLMADQSSRQNYQTAAGKLGTIRAILDAGTFKPDQTYELQCLGIVLGDAFVQDLKMEWVMVEDPQGRDPAVRLPGTSIILFPLTMISKRVERGERVDVFDLYNGVAAKVEEVRRQGAFPATRTDTDRNSRP